MIRVQAAPCRPVRAARQRAAWTTPSDDVSRASSASISCVPDRTEPHEPQDQRPAADPHPSPDPPGTPAPRASTSATPRRPWSRRTHGRSRAAGCCPARSRSRAASASASRTAVRLVGQVDTEQGARPASSASSRPRCRCSRAGWRRGTSVEPEPRIELGVGDRVAEAVQTTARVMPSSIFGSTDGRLARLVGVEPDLGPGVVAGVRDHDRERCVAEGDFHLVRVQQYVDRSTATVCVVPADGQLVRRTPGRPCGAVRCSMMPVAVREALMVSRPGVRSHCWDQFRGRRRRPRSSLVDQVGEGRVAELVRARCAR